MFKICEFSSFKLIKRGTRLGKSEIVLKPLKKFHVQNSYLKQTSPPPGVSKPYVSKKLSLIVPRKSMNPFGKGECR